MKEYNEVKNNLLLKGFYLDIKEEEYKGVTITNLICHDDAGYKYTVAYDRILRDVKPRFFSPSNPFVIENVNLYLKKHNLHFTCTNCTQNGEYTFVCDNCNSSIVKRWKTFNRSTVRNGIETMGRLSCENCDERIESLHALVLKQLFVYYYPDTVLEDNSCINPLTNHIMPTDIVNHRLKIAIEIQSEWHDFEYSKIKDKIKKDFWIEQGYSFYDPDIRNYSILEMCQLFFDIEELPDFIDYDYSNKINIKKIQQCLNAGESVKNIANKFNIAEHRIYDAIHYKKLKYSDNYIPECYSPVIQMDLQGNILGVFDTIKQASIVTNIPDGNISSTLSNGRHYSCGYVWFYKKDYYDGCFNDIDCSALKFNQPIVQYDINGQLIEKYSNIPDAAKVLGVNNYSIYRVAIGERKSIKGFTYKFLN